MGMAMVGAAEDGECKLKVAATADLKSCLR